VRLRFRVRNGFQIDKYRKETVLYNFAGAPDGNGPNSLVRDSAGNLYGTTAGGGSNQCPLEFACGTVFKLDTRGKETVLYTFIGASEDGQSPVGLVRDGVGNVYGATSWRAKAKIAVLASITQAAALCSTSFLDDAELGRVRVVVLFLGGAGTE
jgi:uncharacterized repeat protein (TIGR03803 family)